MIVKNDYWWTYVSKEKVYSMVEVLIMSLYMIAIHMKTKWGW